MLVHPGIFRRTLMLSLAGTRGGPARLRILLLLQQKPRNVNEIAKELGVDYKTAEYHVRVLDKSGFVSSAKKKYANAYELSTLLKANRHLLKEFSDVGKSS